MDIIGNEDYCAPVRVNVLRSAGSGSVVPTRSLDVHEKWMKRLSCPILRLNSSASIGALCDAVIPVLNDL